MPAALQRLTGSSAPVFDLYRGLRVRVIEGSGGSQRRRREKWGTFPLGVPTTLFLPAPAPAAPTIRSSRGWVFLGAVFSRPAASLRSPLLRPCGSRRLGLPAPRNPGPASAPPQPRCCCPEEALPWPGEEMSFFTASAGPQEALWRAVEAGAGLRAEAQSPLGAVGVRGAGLGAAQHPRAFGGARKTPRAGCKTAAAGQERRGKGGKALEGGQRGLARAQRRAKPSRAGPCRGQRPSAGSRRAPASVPAPPPSRWLSAVHSSLGNTLNEPQMAGKRSKKPPGEGAGAARGVRPAAPKNRPGSQHRPGVRGSSRAHPKTSGPFYVPRRLQKRQEKIRPRLLFALGLSGRFLGPARRGWAESGRIAPLRTPRGAPGTIQGAKSWWEKIKSNQSNPRQNPDHLLEVSSGRLRESRGRGGFLAATCPNIEGQNPKLPTGLCEAWTAASPPCSTSFTDCTHDG